MDEPLYRWHEAQRHLLFRMSRPPIHKLFSFLLSYWFAQQLLNIANQNHNNHVTIIRLPDILVGWLRFYRDSPSSVFFFSPSTLGARWTELNQNKPRARKWVRFENACPKSRVYPFPTNRGQKHLSWRLRNLTAALTACIFRRNMTYITRQVRCKLQAVSHIAS